MSREVELFSKNTFNVYKELAFADKSLDIEKAKVMATQNLIKVMPTFTTNKVKIRKGTHFYDASVLKWPTIKAFIKQGVIRVLSSYQEEEPEKTPKKTIAKKVKAGSLGDLVPED